MAWVNPTAHINPRLTQQRPCLSGRRAVDAPGRQETTHNVGYFSKSGKRKMQQIITQISLLLGLWYDIAIRGQRGSLDAEWTVDNGPPCMKERAAASQRFHEALLQFNNALSASECV